MAMLCVWLPKYSGAQKGNVGHASLLLDRGASGYISWWPDNESAGPKEPASPSFSRMTYQDDLELEGGNPDRILSIDCLNEIQIQSWWERVSYDGQAIPYRRQFWPETDHYHLFKTNCANIVALAMRAGGAESFVSMPMSVFVVTPSDVFDWASRVKQAANKS